ncbi:MAG: acrR 5 [Deltaproteobacteria bacterium]|nr:acrR 5 [Deltaproteobacteria bacterium]
MILPPIPAETPEEPRPARPRRAKADKDRTQQRILDAAAGLFAARGYDGASITAIAARAGVSRSAVFWHFSDKSTLFRETFRRMLVPFVEEVARSLEDSDPTQRLVQLFGVYERFVAEQRPAIQAIVRWVIESETLRASLREPIFVLHDQFARDVRDALLPLYDEPEHAEATAMGIVSMLHGNLLLAILDPDPRKDRIRRAGLRRVVARVLEPGERGSR